VGFGLPSELEGFEDTFSDGRRSDGNIMILQDRQSTPLPRFLFNDQIEEATARTDRPSIALGVDGKD
jgi:hypothetical protein